MTAKENPIAADPIETVLQAFEKGDAVAAASVYAADGVYVDPRYPEGEYRGRETIREAFEWALTNILDRPQYTVRHSAESQGTYLLEVDARHADDRPTDGGFPRVLVVEVGEEGITRWRTYLPFPPVSSS